MATVVVIITSIVVANATQSLTTPNAAFISYSLAAGANSAPITPATNKSVLVMGTCTTNGALGVGQVNLQHHSTFGIRWVGLETTTPATVTMGTTVGVGAHIVYIDFGHSVDIQIAGPDTIRVHNGAGITVAGNVTLIW